MSPGPRKPRPADLSDGEDDVYAPKGCKAAYEQLEVRACACMHICSCNTACWNLSGLAMAKVMCCLWKLHRSAWRRTPAIGESVSKARVGRGGEEGVCVCVLACRLPAAVQQEFEVGACVITALAPHCPWPWQRSRHCRSATKRWLHSSRTADMASRGDILKLYRHILKAAQCFPSVKRGAIIADIKQEFRDHKVRPPFACKGARVAGKVGAHGPCPLPVLRCQAPAPPRSMPRR